MRSPRLLKNFVSFATLPIALPIALSMTLALPNGAAAAPLGQVAPGDDPPAATGADGAD